jgi:hypothetical protein
MVRSAGANLMVSSVILGALGLGEFIGGTVMTFSSSDSTQLRTYYKDTYAPAR